jgi:hypothetical protein
MSVGRGGANRSADVRTVQNLLLARGFSTLGRADGICGDETIKAIVAFQSGYLRRPDGRIDPGGTTWRSLAGTYTGNAIVAVPDTSQVARTVPRPSPQTINIGLTAAGNDFMLERLGSPRSSYSALCQPPTQDRLRRNLVLDTVGPFRVTGLVPAVLSLKAVMADIEREQPRVYRALGTAGMLCCRLVRGSTTAISNHSWGTAIDLTLDGVLDTFGDDRVQVGLTLIAPIFNRHGWYWGAAFRKEDAMHFEGSRTAVERWATQLR